jgi:hypothetical protein
MRYDTWVAIAFSGNREIRRVEFRWPGQGPPHELACKWARQQLIDPEVTETALFSKYRYSTLRRLIPPLERECFECVKNYLGKDEDGLDTYCCCICSHITRQTDAVGSEQVEES